MHELLEELRALETECNEIGKAAAYHCLDKVMLAVEEDMEDTCDMQWEVRVAYEE